MMEYFTSIPGIITIVGLVVLVVLTKFRSPPVEAGFDTRTAMQIILSLVIVAAALFVILSANYPDDTQKWAFGTVGTILGFWLPSAK